MYQPPIQAQFRISPDYEVPDGEAVNFVIGETDFSGRGVLSGSVMLQGTIVQGYTVDLFEEETQQHVASTISNASGYFEFTNLEHTYKYYLVVKQPGSGDWEYRISSRRIPVVY